MMHSLIAASSRYPLVLHVLSDEELTPNLGDWAKVVDCETGEAFVVRDSNSAKKEYTEGLDRWLGGIEERCRSLGITYIPTFTTIEVPDLVEHDLRRARVVEHAFGGAS